MTLTIAMVPAGGPRDADDQDGSMPGKALLQMDGRTLLYRVVHSLQGADVRHILVSQDAEQVLEPALRETDCVRRLVRPRSSRGFADGLYHDFSTMTSMFSEDELRDASVLLVPCDLPFVAAGDFAALLEVFETVDADAAVLLIRSDLLPPGMRDRDLPTLPFSDPEGSFLLQSVAVVRGSVFRLTDGRLDCAGWGPAETARMVDVVHRARMSRGRPLFVLGLIRSLARGRIRSIPTAWLVLSAARGYLFRRMNIKLLLRLIHRMYGLRLAVLESRCAAFSADIDQVGDLERLEPDFRVRPGVDPAGQFAVL